MEYLSTIHNNRSTEYKSTKMKATIWTALYINENVDITSLHIVHSFEWKNGNNYLSQILYANTVFVECVLLFPILCTIISHSIHWLIERHCILSVTISAPTQALRSKALRSAQVNVRNNSLSTMFLSIEWLKFIKKRSVIIKTTTKRSGQR